jgi:uncharacterized protein (TIGR02118 family)
MFKALILLKRNEDLDFSSFKTYWLENHAPLVRQLPNIRKAVFNFATDNGEGRFDAVSELWFDSEQDFTDAYASEIGKQVTEDSRSKVVRRKRILLEEHQIV